MSSSVPAGVTIGTVVTPDEFAEARALFEEYTGTDDTADCRAGVSALPAPVCEMKRLYVRPTRRGAHLGRLLAVAIVREAVAADYATMVLDTLETMAAAQALYRSLGFVEIEPYYDNPLGQVTFMALDLTTVTDALLGSTE
jgi:ribosomal protein S18 acetylase RimI-like enzyme